MKNEKAPKNSSHEFKFFILKAIVWLGGSLEADWFRERGDFQGVTEKMNKAHHTVQALDRLQRMQKQTTQK